MYAFCQHDGWKKPGEGRAYAAEFFGANLTLYVAKTKGFSREIEALKLDWRWRESNSRPWQTPY